MLKYIKKIYIYMRNIIRSLIRDLPTLILCKILGPRNAYLFVLKIFRLRCKYNLFLGKDRCLWLGRSLHSNVFKTIYINPEEIKYEIKGGIIPYIQSGDWDLKKKPFELNDTVKEIFIDNIPPKETKQYRKMKAAIENKDWGKAYWCRSQSELENHFKILIDSLLDIKNGKYLTQNELSKNVQNKKKESYYLNEILLSIDRNGNYLHEKGGSHRLSMAKICNIEKIPAVVIRKHYKFVKAKEELNLKQDKLLP